MGETKRIRSNFVPSQNNFFPQSCFPCSACIVTASVSMQVAGCCHCPCRFHPNSLDSSSRFCQDFRPFAHNRDACSMSAVRSVFACVRRVPCRQSRACPCAARARREPLFAFVDNEPFCEPPCLPLCGTSQALREPCFPLRNNVSAFVRHERGESRCLPLRNNEPRRAVLARVRHEPGVFAFVRHDPGEPCLPLCDTSQERAVFAFARHEPRVSRVCLGAVAASCSEWR